MGKKKGPKESEAWKAVKQIPAYVKVHDLLPPPALFLA